MNRIIPAPNATNHKITHTTLAVVLIGPHIFRPWKMSCNSPMNGIHTTSNRQTASPTAIPEDEATSPS